MTSLTGSLGLSLSNLYVKNFFHEDSKDSALSMVKYITNEFLNILKVRISYTHIYTIIINQNKMKKKHIVFILNIYSENDKIFSTSGS